MDEKLNVISLNKTFSDDMTIGEIYEELKLFEAKNQNNSQKTIWRRKMELKELSEQLKNSITTKRINENEYQIQTKLFFSDETPYEIYLMQDKNGNRILTDKRRTLRYMDDFYELESEDVKSSIAEILDIYGVKIYQKHLF